MQQKVTGMNQVELAHISWVEGVDAAIHVVDG